MKKKWMPLAIAFTAFALGFVVARVTGSAQFRTGEGRPTQESPLENEALGFLMWFQQNGREAIPPATIVDQLRILESKAIASGRLPARKGTKQAEAGAPDA